MCTITFGYAGLLSLDHDSYYLFCLGIAREETTPTFFLLFVFETVSCIPRWPGTHLIFLPLLPNCWITSVNHQVCPYHQPPFRIQTNFEFPYLTQPPRYCYYRGLPLHLCSIQVKGYIYTMDRTKWFCIISVLQQYFIELYYLLNRILSIPTGVHLLLCHRQSTHLPQVEKGNSNWWEQGNHYGVKKPSILDCV